MDDRKAWNNPLKIVLMSATTNPTPSQEHIPDGWGERNRTKTQETPTAFIKREITRLRPSADDHMILLGDFHQHHPLWDEDRNTQLSTNHYPNAVQTLLNLIADYWIIVMLPKGLPILQSSSSKNWSRPDIIFCTNHTGESFISCITNPYYEAQQPIISPSSAYLSSQSLKPLQKSSTISAKQIGTWRAN
jgi:hypothetical protein